MTRSTRPDGSRGYFGPCFAYQYDARGNRTKTVSERSGRILSSGQRP
ncbi:MAG: hypothetical protein J2P13_05650 [Acidobacteria bacterium]|nr:hypothetical protein [Acidobacteriota bacterium]